MPAITYGHLLQVIAELEATAARSAQAIGARAAEMTLEAKDTTRVAEMIASRGVDTTTIGETKELGKVMDGLAGAVTSYASAGDSTARAAKAAGDQARGSHSGVNEAVNRSPVDVSNTDPAWFAQE